MTSQSNGGDEYKIGFACYDVPVGSGPTPCTNTGSSEFSVDGFIDTGATASCFTGGRPWRGVCEYLPCDPVATTTGSVCNQVIRVGHMGWGQADYASKKLYAISWWGNAVYCLDVSDPSAPVLCAGFSGGYTAHGLSDLEALSVMPGTGKVILVQSDRRTATAGYIQYWDDTASSSAAACIDVSGSVPTACTGGFPASLNTGGAFELGHGAYPILNSAGIAIGFGLWDQGVTFTCYQLADGSAAVSEVSDACDILQAQAQTHSEGSSLMKTVAANIPGTFGARTYIQIGNFVNSQVLIVCYDGETKAACPNHGSPNSEFNTDNSFYGIQVDPSNDGSCMWGLGHVGTLMSWSTIDPSEPCSSGGSSFFIVAPAEAYCRSDASLTNWASVKLLNTATSDYTSASLQIVKESTGLNIGMS